jgi:hypothetical protein
MLLASDVIRKLPNRLGLLLVRVQLPGGVQRRGDVPLALVQCGDGQAAAGHQAKSLAVVEAVL